MTRSTGWIYPQSRVTPSVERAGIDQVLTAVRAAHPEMGLIGQVPVQGAGPRTALNIIAVSPKRWRGGGLGRSPSRRGAGQPTPFMMPGYFIGQFHSSDDSDRGLRDRLQLHPSSCWRRWSPDLSPSSEILAWIFPQAARPQLCAPQWAICTALVASESDLVPCHPWC